MTMKFDATSDPLALQKPLTLPELRGMKEMWEESQCDNLRVGREAAINRRLPPRRRHSSFSSV
jgi:hypothetical protein